MRLIILALFLLSTSALGQTFDFTPPDESESISNYGIHFNALQGLPGDRWNTFVYDDNGALVMNMETLTPLIIYGLISEALGGDALQSDTNSPRDPMAEPDRTNSNARVAPGFIDIWGGKTFIKTPYGEAGVGLDIGGLLLQSSPRYFNGDELSFVGQIGPNLLFTSRPIENLHTVVHTSYQFLGGSKFGRRIVLDIQGYYRVKSWLGLYGGIHWSTWDATGETATINYYSKGISLGVSFINLGQNLF